ncbi:ExeM/NucH family extracellular endonuclease [Oscillatoria sp. FACHB-1407]|uniref:ExeM/NucH family extracellular endonuclease n=1 Tax=Oscillatoria sp. FACHB-1407 TaxID=2692847 RepID=UPI00168946EC|nr:ExeM/NucH family extracellular endonuclease [Oscillatoria sp. FACHB-1407]MBD2464131.1 ExeM/NucH family extracellular endonuclease [Oscillatoria sp. FACHB-1407]
MWLIALLSVLCCAFLEGDRPLQSYLLHQSLDLVFLLSIHFFKFMPTILNPGDIAIIGFRSGAPDGLAFVTFKDLDAGTMLGFTDASYQQPNTPGSWRGGENFAVWTATTAVPAGTVVVLSFPNTPPSTTDNGSVSSAGLSGISGSGDQIFVYQRADGTVATSSPFTATVTQTTWNAANGGSLLFGINVASTGGFVTSGTVNLNSTNTSYVPDANSGAGALALGSTALSITSSGIIANAQYNGSRTGLSIDEFKAQILNQSNWTAVDAASGALNSADFSFGSALPTVSIAATDNAAAEAGTDPGTFRITRTGDTTNALTVDYTVATGTGQATNGTDYTPNLTGTATIAAGQSFVDITITPVDDAIVEGNETVTLNLVDTANYDLGTTTSATVAIADNDTVSSEPIDLSTYVRIGRYNLPVPARTPAPTGSQLSLEVSTVTYNPVTDTLFILGDEGTSIVQVTKTGQLVNSMTLTIGDFDDPEGLTHIGGNQFVLVEERLRQANLFTYVPGGTLSRADVQSVKLGTTVGNIGLEGVSFDPQTGGYIVVKETTPQGIFQTDIDFAAGTATNGSSTIENSTNLFDPALANLTDIADVYALSNLLSPLTDDNLLVLSQEDGKIVNITRTGTITSSLTIGSDSDNPLSVANQGHEGVTMDNNGLLYVVNERGGGDSNHPQLWVYAPASYVYQNAAPVEVSLSNATATLAENSSTSAAIRVGTIIVSDDALGTNTFSLAGPDAAAFEIVGTGLFLKAGTVLDFENKPSYTVTVHVDDTSIGATPDATTNFTLNITDITEAAAPLIISEVAPWSSGNSPGVAADWFEVTNTSTTAVDITGWRIDDNSNNFASSVALSGVTSLAPGQSAIFIEGDATRATAFVNTWFGGTLPANVLIGTYSGSGVGLGTGGDAVNLFNAGGTLITGVTFGSSPLASPFATFDNAAGNTSVSTLSAIGVNGAFSVLDSGVTLIGSPGAISTTTPQVTIQTTDTAAAETLASEVSNPGTFRITRTGDTTNALTVDYTVATGTGQATNGTDYTPNLTGTATIAAGQSFVDITITPVDDAIVEGNETVTLNLIDTANYDLGATTSATVAIADNDPLLTLISQIQGSGNSFNPSFGGTQTIEGVVVGAFPGSSGLSGFYVQEENTDWDNDVATSEGIFVFDPTGLFSGNVGDRVRVTGLVGEFTSSTSTGTITGTTLSSSLTQLSLANTVMGRSVLNLGAATLPSVATVTIPVTDVSALERYEGMLVNVSGASGPLTVTNNFTLGRFGQVGLSANGRLSQYTQFNSPSVAGFQAYQADLLDNYILLDDGSNTQNPATVIHARNGQPLSATNTLRGGDTIASISGVLDHRFEGYRVQTRTPANFTAANPRETAAPAVGGSLRVASFNLLNYFNGNGTGGDFPTPRGASNLTEFQRQQAKTVQAILGLNADVIGYNEMENDGYSSLSAVQGLVDALNAIAGAGTYAFITPPASALNANGGLGGDEITVGFIYKTSAVRVAPNTSIAVLQTGIFAQDDANRVQRPPVAVTFERLANGAPTSETFTAVINHFKSKASAANLPGDADQGDGQSLSNATRTQAAQELAAWLATNPTGTPDPDYLIMGDLNAYRLEDPITTLIDAGYTSLFGTDSYSFQFRGQWGSLDHALANGSLASQVTGVAKWHINADEPGVLNYNLEFKSDEQDVSFYNADPFASSDHDPLVVGLNLTRSNLAPTAVGFTNTTTSLEENTNTATRIKVADINVTDDGSGTNVLSLSGTDASFFEIDGSVLYLKAGTTLNFEAKPSYAVTVNVDDASVGSTPDASANFTLTLTNVNEAPVATNDVASTTDLQAVVIPVLANDSDVDANDPLVIDSFTNPANGSLVKNGNNTFTYTPTPGFEGDISFTYTLKDKEELTSTATVNITVTQGSNLITGTNGNDNLVGTNRADEIRALAGNDTLNGGLAADTLIGGTGNDTYIVDVEDVIVENPNEGTDLVRSSITIASLAANVENLTLTGSNSINGTGNDLANVITGNNANNILTGLGDNDTLDGQGGNDTMVGGLGDDTYIVNSVGDVVNENPGEGTDLVRSSVSIGALSANVENLTLTGSNSINGTGNNEANVIIGNDERNTLTGLGGNDLLDGRGDRDTMIGGLGDDTYIVNTSGDRTTENAGEGTDLVQSSVSWTLSNHIENLTLIGNSTINGTGNSLDNLITGNSRRNTLNGRDGNDTLIGGNGDDELIGGSGNDILIGGSGNDTQTGNSGNDTFAYTAFGDRTDRITDFNTTQDKLDLITLFDSLGYSGSNPVADGFLRFTRSGSNTLVQVDQNGTTGGATFTTLVTLNNVNPNNLAIGSNVLV